MNIEQLYEFFFWCMIVNFAFYIITVGYAFFMKDFFCLMMFKLFDTDRRESLNMLVKYIASYKLLIIVFNFTPWLALSIMTRYVYS